MTQETDQDAVYELASGVKLRFHKFSPLLLNQIATTIGENEPKAPMVFDENKARDEENPLDPDYVAAHNLWAAATAVRLLRALVAAGTKLESRPDDMMADDSEEFEQFMELVQIPISANSQGRYTQWVMYVALTSPEDMNALNIELMRLAGAREEDVAEAQALFRSIEERRADNGASPKRSRRDRRAVRTGGRRTRGGDGGA